MFSVMYRSISRGMLGKTGLIILVLCLGSGWVLGEVKEIKNEDKPLKGEWNFQLQKEWAVDSAGETVLLSPTNIEVDSDGNIFILDRRNNQFFVFGPDGKLLRTFARKGEGPGELKMPFSFFLKGDQVIAQEFDSLHFFTRQGVYKKTFKNIKRFDPKEFIDENRFFAIQEPVNQGEKGDALEIFDMSTGQRTPFAQIVAEKALSATSNLGGNQRMVLNIKDSATTPMVEVAYDGNDIVYYGKSDKYQVFKSDLKGKVQLSFSIPERKPRPISMEFKKKRIDGIKVNGGKIPDDMAKQIIAGMPDVCTQFSRILVDKETGLIYISVTDLERESGRQIDIFSPDGRYLYRASIELKDGDTFVGGYAIHGDSLVVFIEDEEGENALVKYKIKKPTGSM